MCKTDIPFPTLACSNCVLQVFIVHICWSMTNTHQTMLRMRMFRKATKLSKIKSVKGQWVLMPPPRAQLNKHSSDTVINIHVHISVVLCLHKGWNVTFVEFHPGLFVIFLQKYLNSKVFTIICTIIALQYFSEHSNKNYFLKNLDNNSNENCHRGNYAWLS